MCTLFANVTVSARLMAELMDVNAYRGYPTIGLAEETKHSCRAIHYGTLANHHHSLINSLRQSQCTFLSLFLWSWSSLDTNYDCVTDTQFEPYSVFILWNAGQCD